VCVCVCECVCECVCVCVCVSEIQFEVQGRHTGACTCLRVCRECLTRFYYMFPRLLASPHGVQGRHTDTYTCLCVCVFVCVRGGIPDSGSLGCPTALRVFAWSVCVCVFECVSGECLTRFYYIFPLLLASTHGTQGCHTNAYACLCRGGNCFTQV
jgi:hypothetical protein